MTQTVEAVFENGVFRPLVAPAIGLSEGQCVRLVVEPVDTLGDALAPVTQVYDGLSEAEVDEIERIALDRRSFFSRSGQA